MKDTRRIILVLLFCLKICGSGVIIGLRCGKIV